MLELFHGRFDAAEATSREALELGRFAQSANAKVAFDLQLYGLRRGRAGSPSSPRPPSAPWTTIPRMRSGGMCSSTCSSGSGARTRPGWRWTPLAATGFEVRVEMHWLASLCLLAEPCRELRDARRAAPLYRALLRFARHNATTPPELCLGSVSRSLGILAATMSDWDAAARHFEDAIAMNAAMDARPWLASTQHDYARMLLARDRPGIASAHGSSAPRPRRWRRSSGCAGCPRARTSTRCSGVDRPAVLDEMLAGPSVA